MTDPIVVVDLFCGAGGFSTGLIQAIVDHRHEQIAAATGVDPAAVHRTHPAVVEWLGEHVHLVAVNHWDPAVDTYRENHPYATVHNAKVQALHPPDAVDNQRVDVLIAGPSCIPWSKANGGMAKDDQKRMSPRHVAHWLELLRPAQFLLENVEGFRKWGPLYEDENGERKMRKDGSLFDHWLGTLRRLGYTVDWETFVAADYGDPQTRKRLFVQGRLEYEPAWPEPTHSPDGQGDTDPWRPAADVIDWSNPGMSIWTRDVEHPRVHNGPPAQTTMARIAAGVRRYCADALDPFADALAELGTDEIRRLREDAVPVEQAAAAAAERTDPFLVRGPDGDGERHGLCVPYVLGQHGGAVARNATDQPIPAVATDGYIRVFNPEALVLPRLGKQRGDDSNPAYPADDRPLHTLTAKNHDGHLITPYLVPFYGERPDQDPRTHAVDEPVPSVPASTSKQAVCRPYLHVYNGNSDVSAIDAPMPTVTANDRLALCVPECYPWGLDVRFRMLKPAELALAQGFPEDYELVADTKGDRTQLIGNAVPVGLARALCRTLLEPTDAPTLNAFGRTPEPVGEVVDD